MSETTKNCKMCGEEKLIGEFQTGKTYCKVCAWLKEHDNIILNDFTLEDNKIILDNILNSKITYLNDFVDILNKPLVKILTNIQKLNIGGKKLTVKTYCEVCKTEVYYKISEYLNRKNYFCSNKCNALFHSNTYGCKEGFQICSKCNKEKPFNEFHKNSIAKNNKYSCVCKVCSYLCNKDTLNISNSWSIEDYYIILDNLLNKKVECINEIIPLLNNKTIEDLTNLLSSDLIIKATEIRIKDYCEQCNKEIFRPLAYYVSAEHHFCSKECYDSWQTTSVEILCANCNKPVFVQPNKLLKNKNIFCCHKCSSDFVTKEATEIRNCIECGEEFTCKASIPKKLCSKECVDKYLSKTYSGENSALYSQFKINCEWCGREYSITPSHFNNVENHFCSIECRQQWYKNVYSQSEEVKERTRKQTLHLLENGLIPSTRTGIHKIISTILINNKINIKDEKSFDYYSIDIFLLDYNLAIETMGKYWHCDSRKYKIINYKTQVDNIYRDKSKNTYFKNKGVNILYLWEDDINNNLSLCLKLIELYVSNNGILDNYHSFNYDLINDNIILNEYLIKPYMEYSSEGLNDIIDLSIKKERSRKQHDKWVIFNCDFCGKEKETRLVHYNSAKNHFCSQECKAKFEEIPVIVTCNNCNKDFQIEPCKYNLNKSKVFYCSKDCMNEHQLKQKIKHNCLNCNKELLISKFKDEKSDNFFCDRNCYDEYRKNNVIIDESKWITFQCEHCGKECEQLIVNYNKHKNHFCGKECHDKFQKQDIIFQCENCGKEVTQRLCNYNRSNHHFCNLSCATSFRNKNNKINIKEDI